MLKSYADYCWPLKNPEHSPFIHQKETVEFLLANKRAFVLSDIGTGKTLSVLWTTDILLEMGAIKKVLIFCPISTMQLVWGKEIFTNFPKRYYTIAHGTMAESARAIHADVDYVIINHDAAKFRFDLIMAEHFDVIVIDELTAFKNISADRHKALKKITKSAKAVWGLTGAPTPNGPLEAYGQARIVNPLNPDLPPYFGQYRDIVVQQVAMGVWVPTIHAQTMVHRILQPAIRHSRDDCLSLPPVLHQYVELKMTKEQQRLYDAMRKELYVQYENGEITAVNAGVKLVKLLQISAGAVYDDERLVCMCDADPKYEQILETFEELGRTKLIVVAAFRHVVERLCEKLINDGIRASYIHGEVKNRTQIINDFQDGDLQILVLQPQAVAHGITLTAANTIIWHSFVSSGEVHLQMNGRITRAGQTRKQFVKYLMCSKAEKKTVDRLIGKEEMSSSVLDLFKNQEL